MRLYATESERQLAHIREVSVTLSVRALIRGKIAPTSFEVIRPLIRLSRTEEGSFRFGMGEPDSAAEETESGLLTLELDKLSGPSDERGRLGHLKVSVSGASLRVEDRKLGITWVAKMPISRRNVHRSDCERLST